MLLRRPSVGDRWDVDIAPTLGHGVANCVAIPMTVGYSMGPPTPHLASLQEMTLIVQRRTSKHYTTSAGVAICKTL